MAEGTPGNTQVILVDFTGTGGKGAVDDGIPFARVELHVLGK